MLSIRICRLWIGALWATAFLLCTAELGAQQHLVDEGGTVTACDFYFLDDGGALGDAGTGVDHTTTFCPETAGGDLTFSFSTFALSAGDTLFLWRGDDAAGPPDESHTGSGLVGVDVGNGVGSDNPSGCMTWRFVSGGAGGSNWAALVSCSAPCSRPVASVAAALDGVAQSDVVETCLGTEVQFDAGATVLPTTSGAAGWLWDFGDGSGGDLGQAPVHAYSEPGVYSVQLTVTDSTGCSSVNSIGLSVHVAAPIAIDVPATGPLVCEGGTAVLGLGPGGVTTTPVASQPNASFGAGIVIPDSVGQAFTSAITFSGFQYGQAVADSGDIAAVNLNLEHSFILDLVVELECPNGSTMVLQGWPGGAGGCINAGLPVTADNPPEPGVGFDYSWSPGETVDWQAAAVSLLPTPTSGCASTTPPLPAGSYAATGDWTALEGCPINGTWTLHLMDTQAGDNGFLFGWSIDFAGDITPEQTTFEATVGTGCDSVFWAPAGNWDFPESAIGDCASLAVEPSVAGTYGYVLTAVDAFGCTADTTVHITVEPGLDFALSSDLLDATAGVDEAVCEDVPFTLQAHPLGIVPSGTQYNWVVNGTSTGQAAATYVDPDPALGTYEVIFQATVSAPPPINGVCQFEWTDTIEVVPLPTLSLDVPNACSNVPVDLTITTTGEDPSWQWTLVADGLDTVSSVTWDHPNLSLLPAGEYALYGALSDVHGCGAADVEAFTVHPAADAGFVLDAVCAGEPLPFTLDSPDDYTAPNTASTWSLMGGGALSDEGGHLGTVATGGGGFPQVILTMVSDNPDGSTCTASSSEFAMIHSLPVVAVYGPDVACDGEDALWLAASTIPFPGQVVSTDWVVSGQLELTQDGLLPLLLEAPALGQYTVGFTAVSDQGCVAEHILEFEVQPIPDAGFTLPAEVCQDSPVALDLASADSTGHIWTANGAVLEVVGPNYPASLNTSPGAVNVVHIATLGSCSDTAYASLEVAPLPEAIVAGPTAACAGDAVQWTDASVNPTSDPLTFEWIPDPDTDLPSSGGTLLDFGTPAPGLYGVSLSVTTNSGCSDSTANALFVGVMPVAEFQLEDVCAGEAIPLDLTDADSHDTADVQWWWNGMPMDVPTGGTLPDAVSVAAGPQTIEVALAMVYPEITCSSGHDVTVEVHAQPEAGIIAPGDFCAGPDAVFEDATAIDAGVTVNLAWTLDDGSGGISAGEDPSLVLPMPAPGTYAVTLTASTPAGCSSTASDSLTVFASPDAGFTLPLEVCQGSPVQLDTYGPAEGGTWTANGVVLTPVDGLYPAALTSAPGNVTVVHTVDLGNCSDTAAAVLAVAPMPDAIATGPTAACTGDPVQWHDASINPTSDPLTLAWTPAPGTVLPAIAGPTLDFGILGAGTYGMTLTVTTASGCADSTSAAFFVGSTPVPGFALEAVCAGEAIPLALDDPNSMATSDAQWLWNGVPLAVPSIEALPEDVSAMAGAQEVTLTLDAAYPQITCTAQHSVTVEVYAQPMAAISAPADFCAGPDAAFTDVSMVDVGVDLDLFWTLDEGSGAAPSGTDADFLLSTPAPGTYAVSLTASTADGCSSTASDTLTVFTSPDAGFTLPAGVCQGNAVEVVTVGPAGDGDWSADGLPLIPVDGLYPESLTDAPGTLTVVHIVDLGNCSDTASATLEVHAQPDADFTAPADFCAGPDAVFTDATAIDAGVGFDLQWTLDDSAGTTVSGDEPDLWLTAPAPGVYAVTLTATTAAGCTSSAADTVVVYAAPDAAFSLPSVVCEGSMLSVPTVGTPGTLSWTLDGQPVSTSGGAFAPAMTAGWGTRTVGVTVTLGSGPSQCEDSHEESLLVEALPVVDFTGAEAACAGEVVQWQEACDHPQGLMLATAWSLDGEAFGVDANLDIGSDTAGQYTVGLTATSPAGCSAETDGNITFEALPVPAFTLTEACSGSPILWEPQGVGFFGVPSWIWDDNAINMEGDSVPAVVSDFPGEQTLILTLAETYPSGITCSSTDSTTTVVHPTPTADIVGPQDLCEGDTAAFSAMGTTPVPSDLTYVWSWDGATSGTATGNDLALLELPMGTVGIALEVTATGDCAATASTTMEVVGLPDADFTLPESACVGSAVSIGSGTGDATTLDSTWTLDAMPLMWTAPGIPAAVTEVPGIHVVALTVALTSGTVTCTSSSQEAIEVHAVPEADWDVDPEACSGLVLTFEAESQIATGVPLTSTWSFIGGDTLSAAGATLALGALEPGQYTVQFDVVGAGGCAAALEEQLTVHPSPDAAFDAGNACVGEAIEVVPGDADGFATGSVAWTWNGNPTTVDGGWMDPMVSAYSGPQMLGATVTTVFPSGYSCSDSHMTTVEVWPNPQAEWDVPAGLCEGEATAFTGSSTIAGGGGMTTLWSWNAEGAPPQWEAGETVDPGFLPAGTQAVSMVVESEWGCRDSLYSTFDVHPLPVADFSMEAACAGGTVEWMALEPQSWTGVASWTWNGSPFDPETPGIGTDAGGVLPDEVSAEPGIQWIGVGLSEMHGDGTVCSASAMESVEVHPQPFATWDIVPGWCAGSSASFTADAGVEVADLVWTLSGPQGTTGYLGNDAELGLLPAGTYSLQLMAGTPNGCVDSLSATVKVHPNPSVAFDLEPVCAGAAIPVNWSGSNTDSLQATWTWNGGPIEVTGPTLPVVVSATPGLQWIQLAASQEFPTGAMCTSAALESVDVFPVPVADVAADTLWCAGEEAVVHADPSGEGDLTCSWATPFGAQFGPVWTLPEGTLGMVPATLTVTSEGGCSGSRNFNVRIDPLPEVVLSDTLLMGCAPFAPELDAATSGYNGLVLSTVWSWPEGEEEAAGWSEEIGVASWPVTCTVMAGDADLMCTGTAYATVVGLEVPEAAFTMFPESPTVRDHEVEFTAEEPGNASAFIWTVNGAVESTQPLLDYAFAPYFGDDYTVCLEVVTPFGCTDETCREVEVIGEVQVYVPSGFTPDNDGINDLFRPSVAPLDQVEDYRFEVYNRWGELVFFTEDPEEGWNGSYPGGSHFAGNEVFNWVIVLDTALELPRRMMGQVSAIR